MIPPNLLNQNLWSRALRWLRCTGKFETHCMRMNSFAEQEEHNGPLHAAISLAWEPRSGWSELKEHIGAEPCTFTWWAALWKQARGQGTSLPRRGADLAPHPAKMWTFYNQSLWVAGILTKPDLVDKGTEDKVVDVVRNLVFHLKKGYMIVKCRGQQEIQHRLSLDKALQRERIFFEDHTHFRYVHGAFPGRTKIKDLLPHRRNACCPRLAVESIPVCLFLYGDHGESA